MKKLRCLGARTRVWWNATTSTRLSNRVRTTS
jgi:hypothetical protein